MFILFSKFRVSLLSSIFLFFLLFNSTVFALELSPEYAKVEKRLNGWNGKTIYLIQEAHTDYQAQKSIIEILKTIIEDYSVRNILVEGGWGDVGLSELRVYGDSQSRSQVADQYLKEGLISAEEYLDTVSNYDLEIWGVEDKTLYEKNMKAFLDIQNIQPQAVKSITNYEAHLKNEREKIFPEELFALSQKKDGFVSGAISIIEYAEWLNERIPFSSESPESSVLKPLLNMLSLSDLDIQKAEIEKRGLIQRFSKQLPRIELNAIEPLLNPRNTEEELLLNDALLGALKKHSELIKALPLEQFKIYTESLREILAQDSFAVYREMESWEKRYAEILIFSKEQKNLWDLSHQVSVLKKLFELKWTPQDFSAEYKFNLPEEISEWAPRFLRFYEAAIEREEAIYQNAVSRMSDPRVTKAAMIVGGFHSEKLSQKLFRKGFNVVIISPRFNPDMSEAKDRKYFEVLKYKFNDDAKLFPKSILKGEIKQ